MKTSSLRAENWNVLEKVHQNRYPPRILVKFPGLREENAMKKKKRRNPHPRLP